MNEKILVVDDEKEIADLVEYYLTNEGFEVKKLYDANAAWEFLKNNKVDMAILDVMMPGIDGMELLRRIRIKDNFPVIMLTAKISEMDKIEGLSTGADDYITKPFYPLEMVARVKAQLRRYKRYNEGHGEEDIITCGSVSVDRKKRKCLVNGKALTLTPTEYEIIKILVEADGNPVGSEEMCRMIWDEEYYDKNTNTITVHVRHIREKMGSSKYIKTVWGMGYKIEK